MLAAASRQGAAVWQNRSVRTALLLLLVVGCGYYVQRAYRSDNPLLFYAASIALGGLVALVISSSHLGRFAALTALGRVALFVALLLPVADLIYAKRLERAAAEPIKEAFTFRAARDDPEAFSRWRAYYAQQWYDSSANHNTLRPDPQGILPFVFIPNTSGYFFQSLHRINNLGFRGPDVDPRKGDHYRIFVIGESPTYGATMRPGDRPWPEVLQDLFAKQLACASPIQVINAGAHSYNLKDNLERLRRDVLPLAPDLVLSYHGINSLPFIDAKLPTLRVAEPPQRHARASPLVGELEYRLDVLRVAEAREQTLRHTTGAINNARENVLTSDLAQLYRRLIQIGHEHNFKVVLSTTSMAVTPESAPEAIHFYGWGYAGIERLLAGATAHNEMVDKLAIETGAPVIDTVPAIAGKWESDLYIDLVHFTQEGSDRLARRMFDGLKPMLAADPSLRCRDVH